MYMEMNSEIAPATQVVYFCDACDLEVDHDSDCWVEGDDDDDSDESRNEFYEDDMWADSNALASAGWGTDEDYGSYGGDY
jgi:hypothetical protein